MIAAIYARKSTDQNLPDAEKSVARQIAHATAYATQKGWTVDPGHVYSDDGISGAEFVKRPGFIRLMSAVKPRPPFAVLIMSEESRLGREQIETAYALKQITDAGVRVFFYLEDRERTLGSALDKVMLSLTNFAAEMEREKAKQRTHDALSRKALAGHVAGGACYGYRNVDVQGAHGERSHVLREIVPAEAAVIRRIFTEIAAGRGYRQIAKCFNADGMPSPRSGSWAPTMIREMVHRPLYRGQIVWNRTGWIDRGGTKVKIDRPESEWLTRDAPELRIVPEELWRAAHARLAATMRAYHARSSRWGRPPDPGPHQGKYLLTGFTACAKCGATMVAWRRGLPGYGPTAYRCSFNHYRGERVCANRNTSPVTTVQTAVLAGLREQVFAPDVWRPAFRAALAHADAQLRATPDRRRALERQRDRIGQELDRLTTALAHGGSLPSLVAKIQEREAARADVERLLAAVGTKPARWDGRLLERRLLAKVADWEKLLAGHLDEARELLRLLLPERLRFTPRPTGGYEITGPVALGGLLLAAVDGPPGVPYVLVPPG